MLEPVREKIINIDKRWQNSFSCEVLQKTKTASNALIFYVKSDSGAIYRVILKGLYTRRCNCIYGEIHDPCSCKHVLAAANFEAIERGYEPIMPVEKEFNEVGIVGCVGYFGLAEGFKLLVRDGNSNGKK